MTDQNWTKAALHKQLYNIYYAAGDAGSYGGSDRLFKRAKELGLPVTKRSVDEFLQQQLSYSLHKPLRHKFTRNHTYVANIDQQWQADLADMQAISGQNDGYNYILTCVDVLSRYAWAIPVRTKAKKDMLVAVKKLFRMAHPRKPTRLQTDKGKEFFNADVSNFLREQGVHHFASNSDQKASIVERFNRTLKTRIWTYFTAQNTQKYINVLNDIVYSYNNSTHRSIRMRPADVDNDLVAQKAWFNLFYKDSSAAKRSVQKDQLVRISKWKGNFDKGYMPNWSREHFVVQQRYPHPQNVYKLVDTAGEPIEGNFYGAELQPITKNKLEVERVLQKRLLPRSKKYEVLVKWRGWPDKFNKWIPQSSLSEYSAK